MMSFFASNVLWDSSRLGIGTFEGAASIRGMFEGWFGPYEQFEVEPEEVCALGNGVVLVVDRQAGRPAGSTGHVRRRQALVILG